MVCPGLALSSGSRLTSSDNTDVPDSPRGSGKSKVNTEAIAGGIVGGVVVVSDLIAAIFFLRRHKRAGAHQPVPAVDPELAVVAYADDAPKAVEINSTPVAELDAGPHTPSRRR